MLEADQANKGMSSMKSSNPFADSRELLENLPGHVYWLDKNNVYQGCNHTQAKAFGLASIKDIIGKRNIDLKTISKDIAEQWDQNNIRVFSTQEAHTFEEMSRLDTGKITTVLSRKKPVFDMDGNLVGLLGMSLDLSSKNQIENMLRKERDELGLALDNIISNLPGHVYWQDTNNVFLGCNEEQAKSAGLKSRFDIVGKTNYDMPWRDQAHLLNSINNEVMKTGLECSVEEEAILSNGKKTVFISKKVPLRNSDGETVGILGISFDISERKQMEKKLEESKKLAEAASNAKTEFLQNMRHDIRTPLSGIIGFSELLKVENDSSKIKEYAQDLEGSSQELLRFLNGILESINVASGKIPLLKKRFDLRETLDSVVKLNKSVAMYKDLDLSFDFDERIPKYLLGDPTRIYRVALELITNALKFTQIGHVKIAARLKSKKDRDIVVELIIEDSGPGISADMQDQLFVRFNRAQPSYQGICKGSGLGLSIIKQFIDDMDGEIDVEMGERDGTKFTCLIPLKISLLAVPVDTQLEIEDTEMLNLEHKPSILVVEDHLISASVVQNILEGQNCEITVATSGEAAVQNTVQNTYDMIIMDVGLPGMDGCEATRLIRTSTSTQNLDVPVVGLTGHIGDEKRQMCLDAGMNTVLIKPFTIEMAIKMLGDFVVDHKNQATIP